MSRDSDVEAYLDMVIGANIVHWRRTLRCPKREGDLHGPGCQRTRCAHPRSGRRAGGRPHGLRPAGDRNAGTHAVPRLPGRGQAIDEAIPRNRSGTAMDHEGAALVEQRRQPLLHLVGDVERQGLDGRGRVHAARSHPDAAVDDEQVLDVVAAGPIRSPPSARDRCPCAPYRAGGRDSSAPCARRRAAWRRLPSGSPRRGQCRVPSCGACSR